MTIVNSEPCAPRGARTVLEGVSTAGLPHDLDVDVARLKLMKADYQSKHFRLEDQLLKAFPQQLEQTRQIIAGYEQDMKTLSNHPLPKEGFIGMEAYGKMLTEKEDAGKAILEACKAASRGQGISFGTYRGLDLRVEFDSFDRKFYLYMRGSVSHKVELGTDPRGNILRMDHTLAQLPARLDDTKLRLANVQQQIEAAHQELNKPFIQEDELRTKSARLAELDAVLNMDHQANTHNEKISVQKQLQEASRPGHSRDEDHDWEAR